MGPKPRAGPGPRPGSEGRAHSLLRTAPLPPESPGDPDAKHSGNSLPDRVNLCFCLAMALPECAPRLEISGVILGERDSENTPPWAQDYALPWCCPAGRQHLRATRALATAGRPDLGL